MRVIEIIDHEASERPLAQSERNAMLAVRHRLEKAMQRLKPTEQPETSLAEAHHLVYLANEALFNNGNASDASHATPVHIFQGEKHHGLAFKTFGYKPQETSTKVQKPNGIAISEKKLTKENVRGIIKMLGEKANVQVHHVTDSNIESEDLELPGWTTKIIEYAVERNAGGEHHEKIVPASWSKGGIDKWVVMHRQTIEKGQK